MGGLSHQAIVVARVSSPPTGLCGKGWRLVRTFRGALTTFFENREKSCPASGML
jgi:hypothetical protein